jgi:hypothetical protein
MRNYIKYSEYLIIGFIFLILFGLPVLFTRVNGDISWTHVFKIWEDQSLLIPIFALNHWVFAPRLLLRQKYISYIFSVLLLVSTCTISYYYFEQFVYKNPTPNPPAQTGRPTPIPPYALLLMDALLIVGVDTGLLFLKKWNENEKKRTLLEKKNAEMQLDILRNQISPHFFMNTLNNIYALIDFDTPKAKEAVMKLSKLMRYMLYENGNGKVKISKEFEFIKSYIDLMKLRFADEMTIHLTTPEIFVDDEISPMLFISYIENAFKYGASYQHESFINIVFEVNQNRLRFACDNSKHKENTKSPEGGLGMINNENRLKLIYGTNYSLEVNSTDTTFHVSLEIPIS